MAEQQQITQNSNGTFFEREKFYNPVPENGDIMLDEFLAKTAVITGVFESFGKTFSPVQSDMDNNIKKIRAAMVSPNGVTYKTIQELIEDEVARNVYKSGDSGTVAGVWLGRGLKFMYLFFEQLVKAYREGNTTESNTGFVSAAYDGSLKKHHNFISKGVFKVVVHASPNRSVLCKRLMKPCPELENMDIQEIIRVVIDDMESYLVNLKATTDTWNRQCMEVLEDKYDKL